MPNTRSKFFTVLTAAIAVAGLIGAPAEARRGGSFGSRGSRTYSAPSQTSMMPRYGAPVQRSMTPPSANGPASIGGPFRLQGQTAQSYQQSRPLGRFGGFGGGLVGGLLAGGLIGSMMGHGGGWGMGSGGMGGGLLISLIQIAVLGGIAWFVIGFFRRRAKVGPDSIQRQSSSPIDYGQASAPSFGTQSSSTVDITVTDSDKADFERLLTEVQDAFGHEDYGRLRGITTPEIMSYLSEELSQNATSGRRNDVSATRLIDAEISEAWREDNVEYATIAMRYASIDVMRDRASNAVVEGDPNTPTETSEIWTFVRPISGAWKLSAIQE